MLGMLIKKLLEIDPIDPKTLNRMFNFPKVFNTNFQILFRVIKIVQTWSILELENCAFLTQLVGLDILFI